MTKMDELLKQAVRDGKLELATVRSVLQQGADVNAQDEEGNTLLHYAARDGWVEIAHLLLENGADIHARAKDDTIPLDDAAWLGGAEVTRLLLEHGAGQNQTDLQRAVRLATLDNGYDAIPVLQEYGAQIRLVEALYLGDAEKVKRFLNEGADVNQIEDGKTLLMHAVTNSIFRSGSETDFVTLLLKHGANVNQQAPDGRTALMRAVEWGDEDCVRLLLKKGANPNVSDQNGETALSLALRTSDPAVALLLQQAGAIK